MISLIISGTQKCLIDRKMLDTKLNAGHQAYKKKYCMSI